MSFKNKNVIVTGASSGIGQATAIAFAKAGAAQVVVHYCRNEQGASDTAKAVQSAGAQAIVLQADLTEEPGVMQFFEKMDGALSHTDGLVNNACSPLCPDPLTASLKEWQAEFNMTFFSAVMCSQQWVSRLQDRTGFILNTSSIYGLPNLGSEVHMAYSAAKAALASYTQTMAIALAPNITVNAVAPGYTKTPAFDGADEAYVAARVGTTLLNRWVEPAEIAHMFVALAENRAMTGQVVTVDAGASIKTLQRT